MLMVKINLIYIFFKGFLYKLWLLPPQVDGRCTVNKGQQKCSGEGIYQDWRHIFLSECPCTCWSRVNCFLICQIFPQFFLLYYDYFCVILSCFSDTITIILKSFHYQCFFKCYWRFNSEIIWNTWILPKTLWSTECFLRNLYTISPGRRVTLGKAGMGKMAFQSER